MILNGVTPPTIRIGVIAWEPKETLHRESCDECGPHCTRWGILGSSHTVETRGSMGVLTAPPSEVEISLIQGSGEGGFCRSEGVSEAPPFQRGISIISLMKCSGVRHVGARQVPGTIQRSP